MINYLTKFLENLSDICEPIRKLTHKENAWNWTFEHDKAFEMIKKAVTKTPVLKYFDSKSETTLQCDASEKGLGASLMQDSQPIAYASRALTKTEQNYAQIEKELLAVVFGMEKFHQYTYGRKVYVESDHKPLESLYKKPLYHAPKRLQRMFLRLQRYDIELKYKQGKYLYIADTLSRAYLRSTDGNESKTQDEILLVRSDIEVEVEQINMTDYLAISEERQKLIAQSTQQDKTLQQLIKTIENGWNNSEHPSELDPFYNVRDELSVQNGIIFKGDRCIIPNAMRNEILSQIHTHIGIEGCLKRARECVYWPRMNSELRDYISKCDVCQSLAMKQPKETLKSHDVPSRPWAKIGTDLFTLSGNDYLITVDYYSSFFEVDRLYDTSSKTVINKLKQHFARWGIPETVISDNGPQYSSEQFKQFSKQWDFQHKTSSPGHAQSNGKVENAVKTAKRLMRKAKKSNSDPYIALLNFRNTPQQVTKYSPVQQMINRRTRTLLPMKSALFESKIPENVRSNIMDNKKRQEKYYNRSARDLNELKQGEIVRLTPQDRHKEWEKGVVKNKKSERSYEVEKENGRTVRRNRKYLRRTNEQFNPKCQTEEINIDPNEQEISHDDNKNSIRTLSIQSCPMLKRNLNRVAVMEDRFRNQAG
ncbi:Hypothetical predicted protein [Mytilus galloprovincialis]|uniref:Integrase catalytic domain-containing protein n=1 Tax=Mytilus galloprovincialis TaxID=29158 RepID=A0A8B6DWY5_MYTGA|nr:Hypothetical predicted protein [Mytilus galloprovincialis]